MSIYDPPPKDYRDPQEWFLYFRVTKSLDEMPRKYARALAHVDTADDARLVMTSYAAAALDVLKYLPTDESHTLISALSDMFELEPESFLDLSVAQMSDMINDISRWQPLDDSLEARLTAAGFRVEQNVIREYSLPKSRPQAPAPYRPRTGKPGYFP